MDHGETRIEAGAVTFALQYRALMPDQGVSIQVLGKVRNKSTELLRFDCFDQRPHYHYDPDGKNERIDLDVTTHGNPLAWTLQQLRTRLAPREAMPPGVRPAQARITVWAIRSDVNATSAPVSIARSSKPGTTRPKS